MVSGRIHRNRVLKIGKKKKCEIQNEVEARV